MEPAVGFEPTPADYKSAALPAELCRRLPQKPRRGAIPKIEQVYTTISALLLKQISPQHIHFGPQHPSSPLLPRSLHKPVSIQIWSRIDKFIRRNSRGRSKERVHGSQPQSGVCSCKSLPRDCEIGDQPNSTGLSRARQFGDYRLQFSAGETIEKEVRHQKVV